MREQRRATRNALSNNAEPEKVAEEMMKIPMEDLESSPDDMPRPKPDGETKQEMLAEHLTRMIVVGTDMDPKVRVNIMNLFRENDDFFAFSVDDMPRIDPTVMVHR